MEPILRDTLKIQRIVENEGPTYPLAVLLPNLDPREIEEQRSWLEPRFVDPSTGILRMSFHSFVLHTEHHTILVDSCVGNGKERPAFPDWHLQERPYLERLADAGVQPEDVDFVFCTHLHPDHVGWNTRSAEGRWVPTFPNARYLFCRPEFEHWQSYSQGSIPDDPYPPPVADVLRRCYEDSVLPVVEAGQSTLVDDGHELDGGVWVEAAPGHTPGNAMVKIEQGDFRAVLSGDILHHPIQLFHPEQSSAFCFDPDLSRKSRRSFLEAHADRGVTLLPAHFPTPTAGKLVSSGHAFSLDC